MYFAYKQLFENKKREMPGKAFPSVIYVSVLSALDQNPASSITLSTAEISPSGFLPPAVAK